MTRFQLRTRLYQTFVREYPLGDDSFLMPCYLARGVNKHGEKTNPHQVDVTFQAGELHIDVRAPGHNKPVFALKLEFHAEFVATHSAWQDMAQGIAHMITDNLNQYIW